MIRSTCLAFAALTLLAAPAVSAEVKCEGLFGPDATLAQFEQAFGKANVVDQEVDGAEGETFAATVVYPDDPDRRFEIYWFDSENHTGLGGFTVAKADTGPRGLKLGMSIKDVQRLNGKPFELSGFYWDYGGSADFSGGKLENADEGCFVGVSFTPTVEPATDAISEAVSGDQTIRSDLAALQKVKPVVAAINVSYPDPNEGTDEGVDDSDGGDIPAAD